MIFGSAKLGKEPYKDMNLRIWRTALNFDLMKASVCSGYRLAVPATDPMTDAGISPEDYISNRRVSEWT